MSATGVFGPAPPGIDLSKTQNAAIVKAVISLMVIGTLAVVLRVVARLMSKSKKLAIDDYLVILGLVSGSSLFCPPRMVYLPRTSLAICTWHRHLLPCW